VAVNKSFLEPTVFYWMHFVKQIIFISTEFFFGAAVCFSLCGPEHVKRDWKKMEIFTIKSKNVLNIIVHNIYTRHWI
jgi:hypothetical protein